MTVDKKSIAGLLRAAVPHQQRPLFNGLVDETTDGFMKYIASWQEDQPVDDELFVKLLVTYLRRRVLHQFENIHDIKAAASFFNRRVSKAVTQDEVARCILDLAKTLGSSQAMVRKDKRALRRWMDKDTVLERCNMRIGKNEYTIVFLLQCMSVVAQKSLQYGKTEKQKQEIWKELDLEKMLEVILEYGGDERLRIAVFKCFAESIKVLPSSIRHQAVRDSTLNYVYRFALQPKQPVLIQLEALNLLAVLSVQNLKKALRFRLTKPAGKDDIFIRHRAVALIGEYLHSSSRFQEFISVAIKDPSPYVRQAIPSALARALTLSIFPVEKDVLSYLKLLVFEDERHEVRAAAILIIPQLINGDNLLSSLAELLCRVMREEAHPFVLRTCFKIFKDILQYFKEVDGRLAKQWVDKLVPVLIDLHRGNQHLPVRRWAAQTINFSEVILDVRLSSLYAQLNLILKQMKLGSRRSLPQKLFSGFDDDQIGRVLSLLAEENGSLTLKCGFIRATLSKGDQFDFKLWRLIHEMLRPSPDKRQAHLHTIGRTYKGDIHVPAPIMAELTETKVPGEPLLQSSEAGWRPYLPLVDLIQASLAGFSRRPIKLYTAEGRTDIHPPGGIFKRWWARTILTLSFARYAQLRNWKDGSADPPTQYTDALRKLGVDVGFSGYSFQEASSEQYTDPSVKRFYVVFPAIFDPNIYNQFKAYFFTIYENSLYELAIFASALLILFLGLRLLASHRVNRSRKNLALVVGGWGTRGKSGVERLKAALFESLGHPILSKSTGCEAMFLHAYHFGRNHEMFLFRPYDKATIWEHHGLIKMADQMKCSVFLWECMGLTPSYVQILQHKWSKDDFSTITNTYPDHEDIQGPAGYDIPQVMRCFVPEDGILISSEEQMHPILQEDAVGKNTEYHQVGWLEAGLLTEDVLARFPYEEHPYNIALVVALGEQLGIRKEIALKEMADRVIPDIGVLKSFPKASVRGRFLEFVNGMSANERYATLSNWQRMGFETGDDGPDPGIFLHVLVNNRADRISRSQMFGNILAVDVAADRYVLIGSNLTGLRGYITSSWEKLLLESMERLQGNSEPSEYADFFRVMAQKLRVPHRAEFIFARVETMLAAFLEEAKVSDLLNDISDPNDLLPVLRDLDIPHKQDVVDHVQQHLLLYSEYHSLMQEFDTLEKVTSQIVDKIQSLLTEWFNRRIVVIEDFHATGDHVINRLCQESPPGLTARIMGMQNIKGTGLDYVYRWQAWERCWTSCNKLRDDEEILAEEGLQEMMAFQDYGILCEDYVKQSLAILNEQDFAQSERFQAGIKVLSNNLEKKLESVRAGMEISKQNTSGLWVHLVNVFEALLDAGDAVKRKKIATKIYQDLTNERISHERAAIELQALNKRQKGGWLLKQMRR